MVRLQIRLKSESAAFLAGEQVSGDLILDVDSPTKARRVCLEAFGHAYNHWTESHSDGKGHSHTESYTAEKQFINVVILVWKAPGGGTGILEPGDYCFPFSFVIPPDALPNHHSRYGVIDYWCKGKVDRPWRVDDEVRFPFLVANIADLNVMPAAANPVRTNRGDSRGCCGGNGFLSATASLSKYGYASQEQMTLTIDIQNDSSETVTTIFVRLAEEWVYQAYHCGCRQSRTFSRDLLSFSERMDLPPHQQDRYQRRIQLPSLQPSYACPITAHTFYLSFSISSDGACSSALCGQLPFHVGTVPVGGMQAMSPHGKVTVLTEDAKRAAIGTVAMDQVVDDSCC